MAKSLKHTLVGTLLMMALNSRAAGIAVTSKAAQGPRPGATLQESLAAFDLIHQEVRRCTGADIRSETQVTAGALLLMSVAYGFLDWSSNSLKAYVTEGLARSEVQSLKERRGMGAKSDGKVVHLTSKPPKKEVARVAIRHLRYAGVAGSFFAAALITATAVEDETAFDWKVWAEELLAGVTGSEDVGQGGTLAVQYTEDPRFFVEGFLNLKPGVAEFYLKQNQELRHLTVGFSKLVELAKRDPAGHICESVKGDFARGSATALMHSSAGAVR